MVPHCPVSRSQVSRFQSPQQINFATVKWATEKCRFLNLTLTDPSRYPKFSRLVVRLFCPVDFLPSRSSPSWPIAHMTAHYRPFLQKRSKAYTIFSSIHWPIQRRGIVGTAASPPAYWLGFFPSKPPLSIYSSLCAFAINDDGADTLSSAPPPLQNVWIRHRFYFAAKKMKPTVRLVPWVFRECSSNKLRLVRSAQPGGPRPACGPRRYNLFVSCDTIHLHVTASVQTIRSGVGTCWDPELIRRLEQTDFLIHYIGKSYTGWPKI